MKAILSRKWYIVAGLGLILALYLLWPSRDKDLQDMAKLKAENTTLNQAVKSLQLTISELNKSDRAKTLENDSLGSALIVTIQDNELLERNNDILKSRYDKAVQDKDTVQIVLECKDLKSALVKSEDKLRRTNEIAVRVQSGLKSQVKIKDSLLVAERTLNKTLLASNKDLYNQTITLAKDLNKSEKRRVRNARMGKVMTFVAAGLTALILIK